MQGSTGGEGSRDAHRSGAGGKERKGETRTVPATSPGLTESSGNLWTSCMTWRNLHLLNVIRCVSSDIRQGALLPLQCILRSIDRHIGKYLRHLHVKSTYQESSGTEP